MSEGQLASAQVGYRVLPCEKCGDAWPWKIRQSQAPRWCSRKCRQDEYNARAAKVKAELKATEVAIDDYLTSLCGAEHKTWASKAACRWPHMQVVGEGQYAGWSHHQGCEIRLYGTFRAALEGTRGGQVVTLHRGVHMKGKSK